jgi:hypothetical protein
MLRGASLCVAGYLKGDRMISHARGLCLLLIRGSHWLSFLPLDAATSMVSIAYALIIGCALNIDDHDNEPDDHSYDADNKELV